MRDVAINAFGVWCVVVVVSASLVGCRPPAARTDDESTVASETASREAGPRWGPDCNRELLEGSFALARAMEFPVSPLEAERIEQVLDEMRRGYGGTLVTSPPDAVLDSPAFLARYLRAFSLPAGGPNYDYRFERILARLSDAEGVLDDPRLDWDVWRSFLCFEGAVASALPEIEHTESRLGSNAFGGVDSARDLLWWYLDRNIDAIRDDPKRLAWWIEQLTTNMRTVGGRPMRRWFLLQLVAATDTKTAVLAEETVVEGELFPMRRSSPFDPFVEVDGVAWLLGKDDEPRPPFSETLSEIARSQKLAYEVWNIDAKAIRPTKAVGTNLALRGSQIAFASILCQESWSNTPRDYAVETWRPVGRRSRHCSVTLPLRDCDDGVYFFTYNARLYVWPKKDMDDAAIAMLRLSGLIDNAAYERYLSQGFDALPVTARSDG